MKKRESRNRSYDLAAVLARVTVGEPIAWQGLEVFPLQQPNGHDPSYALIEDLLGTGLVEITELGEHGAVPAVVVKNRADADALILDGMELRGAKQNRMVNVTILAARNSETQIPVSCVEQGRWSYRSRAFSSSGRTVAHGLRRHKAVMVCESLARGGGARTDQGAVWDRVEEYVESVHACAPTRALADAFAEREDPIRQCVEALSGLDAFGAVVALNGRIVGLDLLDSRKTFAKLWQMLLRGYAMDATVGSGSSAPERVSREGVEAWLRSVAESATATPGNVPGAGRHFAVRGPHFAGGITLQGDHPVHLALFPAQ